MSRLAWILALAIAVAPALTARAAEKPVRSLWDYEQELGLTPHQVAAMKQLVTRLATRIETMKQRVIEIDQEATKLLQSEAPLDELRARMMEAARLQVEMRIADVETSRQINDLLKPAQLSKWRSIQARVRAARSKSR